MGETEAETETEETGSGKTETETGHRRLRQERRRLKWDRNVGERTDGDGIREMRPWRRRRGQKR